MNVSDIVEQLRNPVHRQPLTVHHAADEIDRLRAEVASLKEELASEQRWASDYMQQLAAATGRVEMLRGALEPFSAIQVDWASEIVPNGYANPATWREQVYAARAALSNLNEDSADKSDV